MLGLICCVAGLSAFVGIALRLVLGGWCDLHCCLLVVLVWLYCLLGVYCG